MTYGRNCDWQHSMAHTRNPLYRRKNLTKISYAGRIIANFVPNFVAIATGSVGKNAIGSIRWPIPENPTIGKKNLAKIFYASQVCLFFFCMRCTVVLLPSE